MDKLVVSYRKKGDSSKNEENYNFFTGNASGPFVADSAANKCGR